MDDFEGHATLILGDLVQVSDDRGHSVFLPRGRIVGGEDLVLDDRVWIDGYAAHRRCRRVPTPRPRPLAG